MTATRPSPLQKRLRCWLVADHQRMQGRITSSHQALVRALQGEKGKSSQRLRTWEAWGWLGIGRSSGGKVESWRLTPEAQKRAFPFAGSCDSE
jgi:hypothetical protein